VPGFSPALLSAFEELQDKVSGGAWGAGGTRKRAGDKGHDADAAAAATVVNCTLAAYRTISRFVHAAVVEEERRAAVQGAAAGASEDRLLHDLLNDCRGVLLECDSQSTGEECTEKMQHELLVAFLAEWVFPGLVQQLRAVVLVCSKSALQSPRGVPSSSTSSALTLTDGVLGVDHTTTTTTTTAIAHSAGQTAQAAGRRKTDMAKHCRRLYEKHMKERSLLGLLTGNGLARFSWASAFTSSNTHGISETLPCATENGRTASGTSTIVSEVTADGDGDGNKGTRAVEHSHDKSHNQESSLKDTNSDDPSSAIGAFLLANVPYWDLLSPSPQKVINNKSVWPASSPLDLNMPLSLPAERVDSGSRAKFQQYEDFCTPSKPSSGRRKYGIAQQSQVVSEKANKSAACSIGLRPSACNHYAVVTPTTTLFPTCAMNNVDLLVRGGESTGSDVDDCQIQRKTGERESKRLDLPPGNQFDDGGESRHKREHKGRAPCADDVPGAASATKWKHREALVLNYVHSIQVGWVIVWFVYSQIRSVITCN
jgi:hypothetical protein